MPKPRKPFFRAWLGRLHLWLGLASGILVVLISLSGALYAFRDELFDLFHHKALYLQAAPGAKPKTPEALLPIAQSALGSAYPIQTVTTYADPRRTWVFQAREHDDSAATYFGEVRHDLMVFVNPYDGTVVSILNHKTEFFQLVKMFHWSLLLSTRNGQPIVGYAVLVFVLMLISGMILWWPKKIARIGKKLRVPLSAGWKSKVYALHGTFGFVAFPVSLIVAVTGLAYAFRILMILMYVVAGLTITPPDLSQPRSAPAPQGAARPVLDFVHFESWKRHPDAYSIAYTLPKPADAGAALGTYVRFDPGVYYLGAQEAFDRHSGKFLKARSFSGANRGEKFVIMNYDIHVGAILGFPGKLIAFIASLLCAGLPVTGFLIWRGRRKRRQPASREHTAAAARNPHPIAIPS